MQQLIASINRIMEIWVRHGLRDVFISPGSRNAILSLSAIRHPKLNCQVVPDERSAAFIALGVAQAIGRPVALICTSGSAGLNYTPAVAEAFFRKIPLIILTADRPPEWIDQLDGQTIYQEKLFGSHVAESFQIPEFQALKEVEHHISRMANEGYLAALTHRQPVHFNIPIREPFYPSDEINQNWSYPEKVFLKQKPKSKISFAWDEDLIERLRSYKRIALLAGQQTPNAQLIQIINGLSNRLKIPIFSDCIGNMYHGDGAIYRHDAIFKRVAEEQLEELKPDCIITFGLSIISKSLKLFLRNHEDLHHIHIGKGKAADTYMSLQYHIDAPVAKVLGDLREILQPSEEQRHFYDAWKHNQQTAEQSLLAADITWSDAFAYRHILNHINNHSVIHVANSMAVRYANLFFTPKHHSFYCNRGTSGIDGSTSTALGHAYATPHDSHILLTGDLAFFYDRNAFWNHLPKSNLKVILFNNSGGDIFRMIAGPRNQKELEDVFVHKTKGNASYLCQEFSIEYFTATNEEELRKNLPLFIDSPQISVLEVFTKGKTNQEALANLFKNELR
ncbi:MAG: 2-succinyl-5-enolpyruvyl-6-hydroxy-3-cyclohexene-1-carboxylic-acid synthase [Cyclobacteriaceae bacterium]|nr:2-succinyl-5-enolpyruvyl-6-hydroxy-3-cyclohexene-1-carboxylic-acid synthase [Cyclobacteriaceae bacterium]MCH8515751.1 2-succinyl-5-enolpyruvyl-6-hydroxy-3-cyclohexene-1-carboxylic-acid synthase [Cyclobacteriaceae bacterium]